MKLNEVLIKLNECGVKVWKQVGSKLIHRLNDLPAIEYSNGTKEWLINGLFHRDNDKPAIEYADGSKEWWVNGKYIKCE